MNEKDQENLHFWYQKHKKIDLKNCSVNWLEILRNRTKVHENASTTINVSNLSETNPGSSSKLVHTSETSETCSHWDKNKEVPNFNAFPCDKNATSFESIKCENSSFSFSGMTPMVLRTKPAFNSITPRTFSKDFHSPVALNNTANIAKCLGVEVNKSVSWSSSLLTPVTCRELTENEFTDAPSFHEKINNKSNLRHKVLARTLFSPQTSDNKETISLVNKNEVVNEESKKNDEKDITAMATQAFDFEEAKNANNYFHNGFKNNNEVNSSFDEIINNKNGVIYTSTPVLKDKNNHHGFQTECNYQKHSKSNQIAPTQKAVPRCQFEDEGRDETTSNNNTPNTSKISHRTSYIAREESKYKKESLPNSIAESDISHCRNISTAQSVLQDSLNPGSYNKIKSENTINENNNSKFSSSLLHRRKKCSKFVYPSMEETLHDHVAVNNPNLVKSINEQLEQEESVTEAKISVESEPKLSFKQNNFIAACSLSVNGIEKKDSKVSENETRNDPLIKSENYFNSAIENETLINPIPGYKSVLKDQSNLQTVPESGISVSSHFDTDLATFNLDPNLFTDKEIFSKKDFKNEILPDMKNNECKTKLCTGFQSASGKEVSVSKQTVLKIEKMWEEIDEKDDFVAHLKSRDTKNHLNNGRDCNTSNVLAAKKMVLGEDISPNCSTLNQFIPNEDFLLKDEFNNLNQLKTKSNSVMKGSTGFQSASGKKISVSESSLQKIQKLWDEIDESTDVIPGIKSRCDQNLGNRSNCLKSESVVESEFHALESTNKGKTYNNSREFEEKQNSSVHQHSACHPSDTNKISNQTVERTCRNIHVSECSSKYIVSDNVFKTKPSNSVTETQNYNFKEFEAACSSKTSFETVAKLKPKLNDTKDFKEDRMEWESNSSRSTINNDSKDKLKYTSMSFKTASNKNVETSQGALLKAKSLWDEVQREKEVMELSKAGIPNQNEIPNSQLEMKDRSISPVLGSQKNKRRISRKRNLSLENLSQYGNAPKSLKRVVTSPETFPPVHKNIAATNTETSELDIMVSPTTVVETSKLNDYFKDTLNNSGKVENTNGQCSTIIENINLINKTKSNCDAISLEHKPTSSGIKESHLTTEMKRYETVEKNEINEITEAFLLDASWDEIPAEQLDKQPGVCRRLSYKVKTERESARKRQGELLNQKFKKGKTFSNSLEGKLFQYKLQNKDSHIKLSSLSLAKMSLDASAYNVPSYKCEDFRFDVDNPKCVILDFDDGIELVPGTDHRVGWKEVEKGFLLSPSVNASIVPPGWVANHFRWIVWKLSSMQNRLGDFLTNKAFSLEEVLRQLRYRYDVEILGGKRPVLRKILEQDDVARKTMVLCVFKINNEAWRSANSSYCPLVLTDGWYSIGAQVDGAMMSLIQRRVVKVGTKLIIHGAELLGNPSSCHPLQGGENVQIRMHTNMARLSRWDARLGLGARVGLLPPTLLACVLDDGGSVATLDVVVAIKYPLIYMERSGGKTTMLNGRVHEERRRLAEAKQEAILQELYYEVEREMEEEDKQSERGASALNRSSLKGLSSGQLISEIMERENDPTLMQMLSAEQIELASKWQEGKRDKKRQRIAREVKERLRTKDNYSSVPMLKFGVADKNGDRAMITIWRPREDLISEFVEGRFYRIHYLVPSAIRNSMKQLTWNGKDSFVMPLGDAFETACSERRLIPIGSLSATDGSCEATWGEVDVVGLVVRILDPGNGTQLVYLSDHQANFLCLKCSPSIQDFAYQELVRVGNVISACNCSWKRLSEEGVNVACVTPHTLISLSSSHKDVQQVINRLKENVQCVSNLLEEIEAKLEERLGVRSNESHCERVTPPKKVSPSAPSPWKAKALERSAEVREKIKVLQKQYCAVSPPKSKPDTPPLTNRPFKTPMRNA